MYKQYYVLFLLTSFCNNSQLDVLEEVVEAVDGRCDVFLDGGVRQGTDVLKALALGAKAVFIGRPVLWGLACEVTHTHDTGETTEFFWHLFLEHRCQTLESLATL